MSRSFVASASLVAVAALCALVPAEARAGVFIDAAENTPDRVTHPTGYTGTGGVLTVDVCIHPASPNAAQMVIPVQNIVRTYNQRTTPFGNLFQNANNDVPSGTIDFESVALHELGHCIGLAHANLASEDGFPDPSVPETDYAKAGDGPNNSWNLATGSDNYRGTGDDARGDDVSLHYFDRITNDPFRITASVVDATTYSRKPADLPAGSTFGATANRSNSFAYFIGSTEAVMHQGTFFDEAQRLLTADDVSALRYAMSGLDATAGTADDYDLQLVYGGLSSNCDVVLDFDDNQTSFAVCAVTTARIGPVSSTHYRITNADAYFNAAAVTWHFNTESCGNGSLEGNEACDDGDTMPGDGCSQVCKVEAGYACSGQPSVCGPVCGNGDVQPPSETCDDGGASAGDGCDASCAIEPGWACAGEPSLCNALACGDGLVAGSEACDDGGAAAGDGCDAACAIEPGWACSGAPSTCSAAACGDGLIVGAETCDDGGAAPGDGCDASCQLEPGWSCSGEPSLCTPPQVPLASAPLRALLALAIAAAAGLRLALRRRVPAA